MFRRLQEYAGQFNPQLWVLAAGWLVAAVGFSASIPFVSIYFAEALGLTPLEIGLYFGALAVVRSVSQAIGGELSDSFGRRFLLIHTQWLRAVSFIVLGLAVAMHWGFWAVSSALAVNAMLGAVFMPAANALVSDMVPPEKRLDGFAIIRALDNLGWAAGPAIGGFIAGSSFAMLFYLSAAVTAISCAVFVIWLKHISSAESGSRFSLRDLVEVRRDRLLGIHCLLTFALYLVVAQLIMPFSLYTVEMRGMEKSSLGFLYTLNGLIVVFLQIPVTRLLKHWSMTRQLALGALLYFLGYGSLGLVGGFQAYMLVIFVITLGEIVISPPSLTLTTRLAPAGRIGRYMGVHGFFTTAGWSFGPLLGGWALDSFGHAPVLAWLMISSMALAAAAGYVWFARSLPKLVNQPAEAT